MQNDQELLISIGQITTTQGISGEVRVLPLTDFPERFNKLEQVILNQNGELTSWAVESARQHKQFILLKLAGMDDLNQARRFRNALIQVPESELMPLPDGQFYVFQIIGLAVYDEDGAYLGQIKEVLRTGSNDVYQIINEDNKELLVPALREVVKDIDLENQRVIICPLPGLLDL